MKGTFDFYQRKTTDMLTSGKIMPAILGKSEPLENAADLRTTGWEFELSWNDQLANGLHYSVGFNIADSWAEITKVDNPSKELNSYYVGQQIGEIWGYETYGLFQSQEDINNAPDQTKISSIKLLPGDIRFKDLNGDNEINWGDNTVDNPGDKKIIGNNQPRYRYGLNLSADWKGVDFSMFFQGVGKRDLNLPGSLFRDHYGSEWSVPSGINTDYWSEDNRNAYFPVPRFNGGGLIGQTQTRYLQNAAYCRLKTLVVGYSLPKSWMQKLDIEKIRFFVTGENIWTISDTFKGFDPELDNPYKYPFQKSFAVGLNVTF